MKRPVFVFVNESHNLMMDFRITAYSNVINSAHFRLPFITAIFWSRSKLFVTCVYLCNIYNARIASFSLHIHI
jgi:hypothetical protein